MPRRRQGHFHASKKGEKSRQAEVLVGDFKSSRSKHGIAKYKEGDCVPNKRKIPIEAKEMLSDSGGDHSRYSHKKFKKMETSSEGADPGRTPVGAAEETVRRDDSSSNTCPLAANLSLEALFQVTGHELEKIKLSSQDSDSSEQCAATQEEERRRKRRKIPEASESSTLAVASDDKDRDASKRLRLGKHVCPYCGLCCGKPSVLQKHIRAHTNERPYPCIPCGFSFKTKSNLYKHCKSRAHHLKVSDDIETDEKADAETRRGHSAEDKPTMEAEGAESDESSSSEREDMDDDDDDEERRSALANLSNDASGTQPNVVIKGSSHGTQRSPCEETARNFPSPPLSSVQTCSANAREEKRSGVTSAIPTSIYKPKFHSVPYNVPSPSGSETVQKDDSTVLPIYKGNSEAEHRFGENARAASSPSISSGTEKGCRPLVVAMACLSNGVGANSLAKRRNDQFQLRLEIPRPPPPPTRFPGCSSSSSTSSSCSSSFCSALSPANAPTRAEPVTNGDCLPVPTGVSISGHPSMSHGGEALSRTLKSPKLASPEYLQQHISNLISQNAAIVETVDPRWPRRYTRQNSVASSHNVDAELVSKERLRRYSEDVPIQTFSSKKLALALLANASPPSASEVQDMHQQPLTGNASLAGMASSTSTSHAVKSHQLINLPKETSCHEEGKDSALDGSGGSIVRSLLLVDNAKRCGSRKNEERSLAIDVPHPQNPEGSIIKDLLLKTRPAASPLRQGHSLTTCMRLSGGSISSSNSSGVVDTMNTSASSPPRELLLTTGEQHRKENGGGGPSLYSCTTCSISYRKAENLEVHRSRYCHSSTGKVIATASSGGSFSYPAKSKESSGVEDCFSPEIIPCPTKTSSTGHELLVSSSEILCQKPRGRPRGSKNRPKIEAASLSVRPIPKVLPRIHSKSVSESTGDILQTRDKTIDALKGKLCYRRNSVSGDGVMDSPKQMLVPRSAFDSIMANVDGQDKALICEDGGLESWQVGGSVDDGPILKKHLLGGDRVSPMKKRKGSDQSTDVKPVGTESSGMGSTILSLKSLEHLSRYPMRPSAIHLFGGEVQICDGAETKKMVIDNKVQGLQMSSGDFLGGIRGSESTTSSVVATIAKPVHNSGGTVLQVQDSKMSLINKPVCIPVVSIGRPLMATGSECAQTSLAGSIILPTPKSPALTLPFSIDLSYLKLLIPSSIFPKSSTPFDYSTLPPVLLPSPSCYPVHTESSTKSDQDITFPTVSVSPNIEAQSDALQSLKVPIIAVHSPRSPSGSSDNASSAAKTTAQTLLCPARPTTLAFNRSNTSSIGTTLVSPETPRPEKKYGQCYHNGTYYTYLEFKQSTRVYYCNHFRPLPIYLEQSAYHPKLSMYSDWQNKPCPPNEFGLTPSQAMSLYNTKPINAAYTVAQPARMPVRPTHSSYWTFQQKDKDSAELPRLGDEMEKSNEEDEGELESDKSSHKALESEEDENDKSNEGIANCEDRSTTEKTSLVDDVMFKGEIPLKHRLKDALEIGIHEPKRVKIFEGGFKSNEDYTYVRGRGRGKYVCEECGIRCKKPSMLKKHIRTHTDVRPYTCKHCNFSFKTKGNLTKHMKSKAHHKKCVELGIVPVPVTIDDAQIDEEALARQERIEHQRKQFADVDEDSSLDEDEDDEDDDEYYEQGHEEYKEGEDEDDESMELEGQFEDANEAPLNKSLTVENLIRKGCPEQEIARSLLDLGKPETAAGLSSSIQSSTHFDIRTMKEIAFHQRPTMSAICHSLKRDNGSNEREELIGNPRVAWDPCQQGESSCHVSNMSTLPNAYGTCYDELTDRVEEISVGSNSRERNVLPANSSADTRGVADQAPFIPQSDVFAVATGNNDGRVYAPHSMEQRSIGVNSTNDDCDQPIDLSMPHSRSDEPEWDEEEEDEDEEEMEDDDDEDDGEIVVDEDLGEKVGPFYYSYPEFEGGKPGRAVARENILPSGSSVCQDKAAMLPLMMQGPCQEEGPEGGHVGSNEWAKKRMTSPQCSMLHSYLSDQSPAKRVSIEVVATVSHHRSPVASFDEKDSSSGVLPSPHSTRTPIFDYPASPPSQFDSLHESSSPKLLRDRMSRLPPNSIHNMPMYIHRSLDDDKCICTICNKAFNKPSQLKLHVNIHYFERPFRCDSCAISFRTKGHLQKHKRSVSHYNKVNMNMTFGTPTTDNPRPFKCDDCKIAFRIHGHLAKHLRSKMHIMKLECLGKLPFGTYAEIERSGANLNEIDTTDCENSLESLQVMAHRLVDKVAVPQHWPRERTISGGSCDDQSDGVPYVESPLPAPVLGGSSLTNCASNVPRQFGSNQSLSEDGCTSPDLMDSEHLVSWSRKSFDGNIPALPNEALDVVPALSSTIKCEPNEKHQLPHLMNARAKTDHSTVIRRQDDRRLGSGQRTRSVGSLIQEYEDISEEEESEMDASKHNIVCFACRICGKRLKSAKFLQLHMYVDHADNAVTTSESPTDRSVESDSLSSSILHSSLKRRKTSSPLLSISLASSTTIAGEGFGCQICGERFPSSHSLKQHMLIHAQFRPFVCGICDAGFTNSHFLQLHSRHSHPQGKSFTCQECNLVFGLSEDLKHHVSHTHPAMDSDRVR